MLTRSLGRRVFTLPQILSKTATLTNNTAFASAMQSSNLTNSLDNTPGITAFIPNNAAIAAAGGSLSPKMVNNHIINGFVGYLPDLVVGSTLTTAAGQGVQIKVVDGEYFVGGAKVLDSNLILDNGVAQVIDSVSAYSGSTGCWSSPRSCASSLMGQHRLFHYQLCLSKALARQQVQRAV